MARRATRDLANMMWPHNHRADLSGHRVSPRRPSPRKIIFRPRIVANKVVPCKVSAPGSGAAHPRARTTVRVPSTMMAGVVAEVSRSGLRLVVTMKRVVMAV